MSNFDLLITSDEIAKNICVRFTYFFTWVRYIVDLQLFFDIINSSVINSRVNNIKGGTYMFIGRKEELNFLEAKYKNGKKEFGVIYGRRRIGKSALLAEFLKDKKSLFFQAKKDSIQGNLNSFSYEIDKVLNLPNKFVFGSFKEAFDALFDSVKDERFVVAIDEYPYIVKQNNSFPSIFQEIIDKAPNNIFFIISGSDISMLKEEIENHNSPLYKRRSFEMEIRKLKYEEVIPYLSNLNNEDKISYLSLTSLYPYYLNAINFNLSFEENVVSWLFNEYGAFFSLPDQLLSNSTHSQDIYNAILYAISKRHKTIKEISIFTNEEEAKIAKYMITLLSSELVDKRETYLGNKKTTYYEIGDPMLRFWFSFVYDNQERIKINGLLVFEGLKEEIRHFISFGFEDVSRLYMDYLNRKGYLGDVFSPFKKYKADKSKLGRSVEIDALSDNGKVLIVIECKYRNVLFDLPTFLHLQESASIFKEKLKREYYLFSKSGFTNSLMNEVKDNVHLISLKELFEM